MESQVNALFQSNNCLPFLIMKTKIKINPINYRSIAVDYITDKIYIVDTSDVAVNVYDLNGRNKATVFRNESVIPLEVAIDINRGLMFILAYNIKTGTTQVYRANMDGSSALLITEHKEELEDTIIRDKVGFTLNTMKRRVYFANRGQNMFESVDYDGNGRSKLGEANPPLGITAYNDTVYWSDGGPCKYTKIKDSTAITYNQTNLTVLIDHLQLCPMFSYVLKLIAPLWSAKSTTLMEAV